MVIRRGSPPRTKPRAVATVRPPVLGGSGGEQAEHGLVIKRGSHVRHPADGGKGLKYHKDMAMGDPLSTLLCDLPPWLEGYFLALNSSVSRNLFDSA
ncbi:hypothetical protein E4T56_gene2193, partial [Termitomyces sp. T112]